MLNLNSSGYRENSTKQGVMLPPKRAYAQLYLSSNVSNPVYSRTTGGTQPPPLHDARAPPHEVRGGGPGQPVHDLRGPPHDIRGHDMRSHSTQHEVVRGAPQMHELRGQHEVRGQLEVRGPYPGHSDMRAIQHEASRSQPPAAPPQVHERIEGRAQASVHEVRGQLEVRGPPQELNSPYKRQRTQSPVSVAHPATGAYPYAQTPEGARFSLQGLDRPMYGRPMFQVSSCFLFCLLLVGVCSPKSDVSCSNVYPAYFL